MGKVIAIVIVLFVIAGAALTINMTVGKSEHEAVQRYVSSRGAEPAPRSLRRRLGKGIRSKNLR